MFFFLVLFHVPNIFIYLINFLFYLISVMIFLCVGKLVNLVFLFGKLLNLIFYYFFPTSNRCSMNHINILFLFSYQALQIQISTTSLMHLFSLIQRFILKPENFSQYMHIFVTVLFPHLCYTVFFLIYWMKLNKLDLMNCKVAERLRTYQEQNQSNQHYMAMFSSIFGGITTDPAAMVIPMDDHMVHRGHGVFDTAAIMDG